MYYRGKTIDTFEPALRQLLECEGLPQIRHLDCVALRTFGFWAEGNIGSWFRPFVSPRDAVEYLRDASGISFKAVEAQRLGGELPEAFVLGPAERGIAAAGISDYYYQGEGRYLFVRRKGSLCEAYDPYGFPGLWMKFEEMLSLAGDRRVFLIYVEKKDTELLKMNSEREMMRGISFRKRIRETEERNLAEACMAYKEGRGSQLALHFGILNMLQMLDKVFSLAGECGWEKAEYNYIQKKQKLFRIAGRGKPESILEILADIWKEIERYG